jgi:TonB family protein
MSITGNLRTLELAELLQWLSQGTKTGVLVIENDTLQKKIYFDHGKIVFSESNNPYEHLGSILIREGLIDEATLARAVKLQESTQILLGKVLVTLGSISEGELHDILRRKTEESIYELFSWEEGDFNFVPDEAPEQAGVPLSLEVTNLVLEGLRRLDESRHTGRPLVEDHSGSYSLEIEEVLNTELRKNSAAQRDEDEQAELVDLPVVAEGSSSESPEPAVDQQPYYQAKSSRDSNKTPLLAALAAALVIVVGGTGYFMFMKPDPADGATEHITAEDTALSQGSVPMIANTVDAIDEGSTVAPEGDLEPQPQSVEPEPDAAEDALRSRYEAELASLRGELAEAKRAAETEAVRANETRAAALRQEADKPKPLPIESSGAEIDAAPSGPDPLIVADLATENQESAGGDEPPSLSGRLQTLSSLDTATGSELAEELIEPEPDLIPEPEVEAVREAIAPEVVIPSVTEGEIVGPGPTVNPPVLLTRPKPTYPQTALRLKKEAVVTVRILVDENGRVAEAERIGSKAGLGFDQAAINAAELTQWQPAVKEGV